MAVFSPSDEAAQGLAMAIVQSSTAPMLLLSGELQVIATSSSFSRSFGLAAADVQGKSIFSLGEGEWEIPQLHSLLDATIDGDAEIDAYELDMRTSSGKVRRLVLNARNLSYGDDQTVRLMLTISDVTDARIAETLRDSLVAEKGVLLQELQHRVANSLQIIASVIMQTARKAQSDEARLSLTDAHSRVMSVAELQRQLSVSRMGDVELRAYFSKLCASIGASMIRDHDLVTLSVDADDSTAAADVSVSLGLIVTELVINCLKHAFPEDRSGKVVVRYRSNGPNWNLMVTDDGVGMPPDPKDSPPGLGTSIVRALAQQLSADITVESLTEGTSVSVKHDEVDSASHPGLGPPLPV